MVVCVSVHTWNDEALELIKIQDKCAPQDLGQQSLVQSGSVTVQILVTWTNHTVPEEGIRLFDVPKSGKDIFSLYISPKLEIKLNQNPRSSCISTN